MLEDYSKQDPEQINYTELIIKLVAFVLDGVSTSVASVIEISNFIIFLGKNGTFFLKFKAEQFFQ